MEPENVEWYFFPVFYNTKNITRSRLSGKTSYVPKSHIKFRDRRGTLLSLPSTMLSSSYTNIISCRGADFNGGK